MVAQVLAGVNRAFPFADTSDPTFEKQLDTIFRVAHASNFNTSIQALMLLQQISSRRHFGAERFYKTLYESLLDSRLFASSKQVMYLNLLYKSLKADLWDADGDGATSGDGTFIYADTLPREVTGDPGASPIRDAQDSVLC